MGRMEDKKGPFLSFLPITEPFPRRTKEQIFNQPRTKREVGVALGEENRAPHPSGTHRAGKSN